MRIRRSPAAVSGYKGNRRPLDKVGRKVTGIISWKALPEIRSRKARNRAGRPEIGILPLDETAIPIDAFAGRIGDQVPRPVVLLSPLGRAILSRPQWPSLPDIESIPAMHDRGVCHAGSTQTSPTPIAAPATAL